MVDKVGFKQSGNIKTETSDSQRMLRFDICGTEQRQILAADERMREFNEEKRTRHENFAEEEDDEQNERSRESTEQWREFHYDGMHPPQEYNRQSI
ncbi:hypothetical protein JOQ06_002461 [Pogonophryne albipinna]|uniref:Unique cartilage matrix-associated protein n=1 Tax=Pogonophryne albipinna TaxID=1090488 RepID=A0AAD6FJP2_9TELE|nr:hypothetical protein JOQ06_002461 [Pogonophryne albipinna]